VLLFVNKKIKGKVKVLCAANELRSCVPSCRNSLDHENWFDLDALAADFEVSTKGRAVEDLLSEIGKL